MVCSSTPLAHVDEHDGAVGGHQRPVGVFAEVLVTGGIEDVDAVTLVVELQDAGGYRDAALFFDFHPVGYGVFLGLAAFHRPGQMDGSAVQEQFFGQGGFAGVGVGYDGEGATRADLIRCFHFSSDCCSRAFNPGEVD